VQRRVRGENAWRPRSCVDDNELDLFAGKQTGEVVEYN
jgi:hypothetical protein